MKRITMLAAAGALAATPALGAWAAFAAADDAPATAAHVRIAGDRRGEPEPGDDHGRHHRHHNDDGRHHHRHGADDRAGLVRQARELEPRDDRGGHREAEPGDDRGGHREAEPGDDRGGHREAEPGDDRGGHREAEPGDDHGGRHGGGHGGHDGSGHH